MFLFTSTSIPSLTSSAILAYLCFLRVEGVARYLPLHFRGESMRLASVKNRRSGDFSRINTSISNLLFCQSLFYAFQWWILRIFLSFLFPFLILTCVFLLLLDSHTSLFLTLITCPVLWKKLIHRPAPSWFVLPVLRNFEEITMWLSMSAQSMVLTTSEYSWWWTCSLYCLVVETLALMDIKVIIRKTFIFVTGDLLIVLHFLCFVICFGNFRIFVLFLNFFINFIFFLYFFYFVLFFGFVIFFCSFYFLRIFTLFWHSSTWHMERKTLPLTDYWRESCFQITG